MSSSDFGAYPSTETCRMPTNPLSNPLRDGLADTTPGSAEIRAWAVSNSFANRAPEELLEGEIQNSSTCSRAKPRSCDLRLASVRVNNPAPINNSRDKATCETTTTFPKLNRSIAPPDPAPRSLRAEPSETL